MRHNYYTPYREFSTLLVSYEKNKKTKDSQMRTRASGCHNRINCTLTGDQCTPIPRPLLLLLACFGLHESFAFNYSVYVVLHMQLYYCIGKHGVVRPKLADSAFDRGTY